MLVRSGYSSIYNRKPSLPCFQWRATTISATHCRHRDLSFAALSLTVFKLQSRWITTKHSAQKIHFQGVFITITARFFSVCPSFPLIFFFFPYPPLSHLPTSQIWCLLGHCGNPASTGKTKHLHLLTYCLSPVYHDNSDNNDNIDAG